MFFYAQRSYFLWANVDDFGIFAAYNLFVMFLNIKHSIMNSFNQINQLPVGHFSFYNIFWIIEF